MEKKIWALIITLPLIVVLTILYLLYVLFKYIAFYITGYGAFVLFLCVFVIPPIKYVIRSLVFPGSNVFITKVIEMQYRQFMTRSIVHSFTELTEFLTDRKIYDTYDAECLIEIAVDVKTKIQTFFDNDKRQEQLGTLTEYQKIFGFKLQKVWQAMHGIRVLKQGENLLNLSIMDLGEETDLNALIGCQYSDNTRANIDQIHDFLDDLMDTMDINTRVHFKRKNRAQTAYQKFKKSYDLYWNNTMYGHLDQVRVNLERTVMGQQQFVKTRNGGVIDTMWIPKEQNEFSTQEEITVLYCNPNGCFYEMNSPDDFLLSYYLRNGFNVFLWNYRGYGKSTGPLNPHNCLIDGEDLVKHLKNVRNTSRIHVHGTSLGGAVASHLAYHSDVESVFSDRSFSSLESVVRDDFGSTLRFLYNLFTLGRWKMKVAKSFLKSDKFKILSCDPTDTMIPELSSLKNGVARASLEKDIRKNKFLMSKTVQFYDICTIMTKSDTEAMFYILREIFEVNLSKASESYSKAKSKPNKKKDDDIDSNASIELNFLDSENQRFPEAEIFDTSATNYSQHSETFLDKTTGSISYEKSKKHELITYFTNSYEEIAKGELEALKSKAKRTPENCLEESLAKFYTPEDNTVYENVLGAVKRTLCKLDSAGLTFYHIFQAADRNKIKMFKQFLINLEVWGSSTEEFLPGEQTIYNQKTAKKASDVQISELLDFLKKAIREEKIKQYPFLKLLMQKAGCIGYFLVKIQKHLMAKVDEESSSLLSNHEDDAHSENDSLVLKNNETRASFAEDDEHTGLLNISKQEEDSLGHLIQLNCGHNGCLSEYEQRSYINHLKQVYEHLRDE